MPARRRKQSNAMLYTLITFVGLFITTTTIAVINYVKAEEHRTGEAALQQEMDDLANDMERNALSGLIGDKRGRESYIGLMIAHVDEALTMIVGGVPAPDSAVQEWPVIGEGEWAFALYMFISGLLMGAKGWFLLTAVLYCGLAALAFRLVHQRVAYLAFLTCASSFSFWTYGTNGLRNGLATSLVLLGMACSKRKWLMGFLFFLAFSTHMSVGLPIAAFVLTLFYNKPRYYLIGYGVAVILSIVMGGFWINFFANLGLFEDARLSEYLLSDEYVDSFLYGGVLVFDGVCEA